MCVRRSTRVAYVAFSVSSAVFAGSGSSQAQSLADALSGPANNAIVATSAAAASVSPWETSTQPAPTKKPAAATFDHWQAKITLNKPALKRVKATAKLAEPPFGLHGPIAEGATKRNDMKGIASYYGSGKLTASGEAFDPNALTAAHRTLPFGTRVRITRVDTGQSVVVRINDRGPFKPGRVVDLSRRAAEDLSMTDKGLTAVKLEVVDRENPPEVVENVDQRSLRR
ncbi:MAG: septal ring lytic transglycosylase RlpA family protein [Proteobacteria bacterium]|nr:septal ring lytic transglycosylase RlpA family protein [Pseudomonadota bacterium]